MLFCESANLLNFSSLDAMNLSLHPYVRESGVYYMQKWGRGNTPSRPVPQLLLEKQKVEEGFAEMTFFESATLLEMQKVALCQMIPHLSNPKTLIIKQDSFCYTPSKPCQISTFDALSPSSLDAVAHAKKTQEFDTIFLLVESISSKTGKIIDLQQMVAYAKKLGAFLIVDDTNSFSAMGRHGLGLASTVPGIDLVFGSFSKTFGAYASYILTSNQIKDYILSTSSKGAIAWNISPLLLGFIKSSLELLPRMEQERRKIQRLSKECREAFFKQGLSAHASSSHIIALNFESALETKQFNQHLAENQCLASVLRTSDGDRHEQVLRFIIHANHSLGDLAKLTQLARSIKSAPYCEAL